MSRNSKNKSFLCDEIDPEYEKTVIECFRRQKFINFIGAELLRVLPGFCTLQLKYREKMTHDPSCFHQGVIGALADSAGEFAALSLLPPDSSLATAE
jgi:acyl-coenzyme A thioesterase PaaI-like protein